MNVKVLKRINPTTQIEVEFTDERDVKEAVLKATPFLQIPTKCGHCGSDNISFGARNTKGGEFIYVEVYCYDCRWRKPTGEYKSPKGAIFFKKWEAPYGGEATKAVKDVVDEFGGEVV